MRTQSMFIDFADVFKVLVFCWVVCTFVNVLKRGANDSKWIQNDLQCILFSFATVVNVFKCMICNAFERFQNALKWKNGSTEFSLSLIFFITISIYHFVARFLSSYRSPLSTKSHMWTLGLNLVRCPTIILDIVRKDRPGLCNYYNVISLISKRDLFVLQAYHQSRIQNESSRCFNLGNANSCASYLPKASQDLTFIDFFVLGVKLFNCPLLFVILEWYSIPVLIWKNIKKICKTCHFHVTNISKIRKYLDRKSTEAIIHAFVTTNLDYFNAILYGLPKVVLNRLRLVRNRAARIVTFPKKYEHITPGLIDLHWLPV